METLVTSDGLYLLFHCIASFSLQDTADKKERWVRIMYQNEPLEVLGADDGFIKFEKFAELINSLAPKDYAAACMPQASKPPAAGKAGTNF